MTGERGNFIYVVDAENKIVARDVKTGPLVGSMQLLLSGAEPGETVVTAGTNKIRPGATIRPFWPDEQTK